MHRVVTRRVDHMGNRVVEAGPWQASRSQAEHWASLLRTLGYHAQVESMQKAVSDDHEDLLDLQEALANMV